MTGARGTRRVTQIGGDRLIATARVIISALLLFAIWLDPTQPAIRWDIAYTLLAGYLVVSMAAALLEYQHALEIPDIVRLGLHVADILFITALVYFTQGTTSSVFGFFVYLVVVSHVRWQWKGTLATGALVLVGYFFVMMISPEIQNPRLSGFEGSTDVDGIIVRIGYLGVVGAILVYIGYAQEIATQKMLMAAEWPTVMNPADALPAFLNHSAIVLGAPGLMLLWLAERETTAEFVLWTGGRMSSRKWPRDLIEGRLETPATLQLFYWRGRGRQAVLFLGRRRQLVDEPPFPAKLLRLCRAGAVLGIWFHARSGYGCLLVPREILESDDLLLAQLIADRFRIWADEAELYRQVDEARLREQQLGLATDLHDTVLQTLAGTSLQLQSIGPQIAKSYPQLTMRIDDLVETLSREQKALRSRLHALAADADASKVLLLKHRLEELAVQIEARWELPAVYSVDPPQAVMSSGLDHQLSHILLEAAANAKKHSHASQLTIAVTVDTSDMRIIVGNDRREPIGVRGTRLMSFDPKMLRGRVERMGGQLSVSADAHRVDLVIDLPCRALGQ